MTGPIGDHRRGLREAGGVPSRRGGERGVRARARMCTRARACVRASWMLVDGGLSWSSVAKTRIVSRLHFTQPQGLLLKGSARVELVPGGVLTALPLPSQPPAGCRKWLSLFFPTVPLGGCDLKQKRRSSKRNSSINANTRCLTLRRKPVRHWRCRSGLVQHLRDGGPTAVGGIVAGRGVVAWRGEGTMRGDLLDVTTVLMGPNPFRECLVQPLAAAPFGSVRLCNFLGRRFGTPGLHT